MFKKPRRQRRNFRKKITFYIFLLVLLGGGLFFLNVIFLSQNPLFISPLGKNNIDIGYIGKLLKNKNIKFLDIVFSNSSYLFTIPNQGQIRLSTQKNIEEQVSSLQRILRELTIEGKPFKSIDFRFNEPVVSF